MKPWKAVSIIGVLAFIALAIAFALGGVGVKKNTSSTNQSVISSTSSTEENSLKGYNSKPKKVTKNETSGSSSSSTSSSSEKVGGKTSSESSSSQSEKEVEAKSDAMPQVNYPKIKSEGKSTAVISAKKVYQRDKTLVFCLELTLPTEELGTVTVEYFTSAVNYNTVKVGELLSVEYGVSSDGTVALAVVNTI